MRGVAGATHQETRRWSTFVRILTLGGVSWQQESGAADEAPVSYPAPGDHALPQSAQPLPPTPACVHRSHTPWLFLQPFNCQMPLTDGDKFFAREGWRLLPMFRTLPLDNSRSYNRIAKCYCRILPRYPKEPSSHSHRISETCKFLRSFPIPY